MSNKVDRQDGKGLVAVDSEVTFESLNPVTSRAIKLYVDGKIDSSTSSESNNAVSNRAITAYVNDKSASSERNSKTYTDQKVANISAVTVPYDNSNNEIVGTTVQAAIDEIYDSWKKTVIVDNWQDVQKIVRKGLAAKVFKTGEQLICEHRDFGTLVWDIVGFDHDTPSDEQYTHSMTLQLHDCLNDTFIFSKNNNHTWSNSDLRQWLNSENENWWSAKIDGDTAPNYSNKAGFLNGLDSELMSVIGNVEKSTDGMICSEKIFIASRKELGKGGNNTNESIYENYNLIKDISGVKTKYWLRDKATTVSQGIINTLGNFSSEISNNTSLGVAPMCCIV